jgi:hypothetical protein
VHYQVVAKRFRFRDGSTATGWEYYPYWAPGRDRKAAERLAGYAAQCGHEAAILENHTVESLELLARKIVDLHDDQLVPALRYVPGTRVALAGGRGEHSVDVRFAVSPALDPYAEGPNKSELDRRRLELELGPGGDVLAGSHGRHRPLALPRRMDELSAWVRLYQRAVLRQVGGSTDGAPAGSASDEGAPE